MHEKKKDEREREREHGMSTKGGNRLREIVSYCISLLYAMLCYAMLCYAMVLSSLSLSLCEFLLASCIPSLVYPAATQSYEQCSRMSSSTLI
jgi:hypothetical protein